MKKEKKKCKHCSKELNYWQASYCSNKCQQAYQRQQKIIPGIESGIEASPSTLKKYLLETKGNCCVECGLSGMWQEKPLSLQLDHIDGNPDNNVLTNVRLLCPNCHSQTETFSNKNRGNTNKRSKYYSGYIKNKNKQQ